MDQVHTSNLIKPTQTRINRWKYMHIGAPKKIKQTGRVPYLTDHACHQKPNPSRETVPITGILLRKFSCSTGMEWRCIPALFEVYTLEGTKLYKYEHFRKGGTAVTGPSSIRLFQLICIANCVLKEWKRRLNSQFYSHFGLDTAVLFSNNRPELGILAI
jgi:hypothetical protein